MKNYKKLIQLSITTLLNAKTHLGHPQKFRAPLQNNFILGTRHNIDFINTQKTLKHLSIYLPIIQQISANKGFILIINNQQTQINKPYLINTKTIKNWNPGLLTNFNIKNTNLKFKLESFPDLILNLNNSNYKSTLLESLITNTPLIQLNDTNISPQNLAYPIPANNDSISSVNIINKIFENAIIAGHIKHILKFKNY